MNRIYWDSMLFVYLIEANPQFAPRVQKLLERMESRGDRLLTSVFTLGEVLAGPRKSGAQDVVARIQNWFDQGPIEMLPFDRNTANQYSLVRAGSRASQADAIHLATASLAGTDALITNDKQLHKFVIPGIRFIVGLDGNLF
jgi:predicted nucleic acid-binding protein